MIDLILENYPEGSFLRAKGFDDAIIGFAGFPDEEPRLIYSVKKCLEILEEEGMSREDALEHFSYNVEGSYVGKQTPIWCQDDFE